MRWLLCSLMATAAVAPPLFDRQHPDRASRPRSNAEWSEADTRLPWLKNGLLRPAGRTALWDGRALDPLHQQACVWTEYKCNAGSTAGDKCNAPSLPMCVHPKGKAHRQSHPTHCLSVQV